MTDSWHEVPSDDRIARGLAALQTLDADDPSSVESELVLRTLLRSGVLGEIASFAQQQQFAPHVEPEEDEQIRPGRSDSALEERLPELSALGPRLRRKAIADTRASIGKALRPGTAVLIADAGYRAERTALAELLATELTALYGESALTIDAVDDPMLLGLESSGGRGMPVAVLDGDVAPRLVETVAAARGNRRSTVTIVPGRAIRSIGEALEPDLVLGIPAGTFATPTAEAATAETLPAALELTPNGSRPLRLPYGEHLEDVLWTFVTLAADQGDTGARAIIAACQRLSAGVHQAVVRRVLLARWEHILSRLPLVSPSHALTWGKLFRDAGARDGAREVLRRGLEEFRDDYRLRHALLTLRLRDHEPTANDLAELAVGITAAQSDRRGRGSASYYAHALARAQRRAGDLPAAQRTIGLALANDPDNITLLIEAGLIAAAARQLGSVVIGAERRRPREADAFDLQVARVETHFRAAHLVAPRSGVVLNAWGRVVAQSGNVERAERLLARARDLEPWNPRHALELAHLAKSRGLLSEAESYLLPLLDDPEQATARRVRVELADVLIEAGPARWDDAEDVLEDISLLDDDPGLEAQAQVIGLRAKLLAARGEFARAEALAQQHREVISPRLLAQEASLILAERDPGRVELAENRLDRLRSLPEWRSDPETHHVWATLSAKASVLRGDLDRARATIDREIETASPLPILLNSLADIEDAFAMQTDTARTAAQARSKAETLRRIALDVDPRNAYTHRDLARSLAADHPLEAQKHFRYVRMAGLSTMRPEDRIDLDSTLFLSGED